MAAYLYSDSNIKVKFCEDPPSSQPCPLFLQRTGQRLFLALTDGLPPMHSSLLCWGIRIKTENQFFTSSHSLPISCAVSVQTFATLLPLFSCGFSLCVPDGRILRGIFFWFWMEFDSPACSSSLDRRSYKAVIPDSPPSKGKSSREAAFSFWDNTCEGAKGRRDSGGLWAFGGECC